MKDLAARSKKQAEPGVDLAQPKLAAPSPPAPILVLQQAAGNQAVHRMLQAKLSVNQPGDIYEQEADQVADQVVRMQEPNGKNETSKQKGTVIQQNVSVLGGVEPTLPIMDEVLHSSGHPIDPETRSFMESRFRHDFSNVRVHKDIRATESAKVIHAKAYTVGQDVVFGAGQYAPNTVEGRNLLAHELTHVVQQTKFGSLPSIQRKLELRPPGKGEASAFGRAQELIDRLNTLSPAIQYELLGQNLVYTVKDATALTHFDTVMKGFIDRAELVPMRLITSKGYVGGGPLAADSFISGYVDLDDLLADDVYSFQSDLLHFLTERFLVKDYARRIGTNLGPLFPKAHRAGKDAEAAQLQYLFNDPSIVFAYEETKPNHTWVNAFKSKNHEYWIFQVMRKSEREVAGGEMWVQKKDGTRLSIDDFRKERALSSP